MSAVLQHHREPDALGGLGTAHSYLVERESHELQLRDGSTHHLHFVREHGYRHSYLRAVRDLPAGGAYTVVDLRDLAYAHDDHEVPGMAHSEMAAIVKYTLRALYADAPTLRRAVLSCAHVQGEPRPLQ